MAHRPLQHGFSWVDRTLLGHFRRHRRRGLHRRASSRCRGCSMSAHGQLQLPVLGRRTRHRAGVQWLRRHHNPNVDQLLRVLDGTASTRIGAVWARRAWARRCFLGYRTLAKSPRRSRRDRIQAWDMEDANNLGPSRDDDRNSPRNTDGERHAKPQTRL